MKRGIGVAVALVLATAALGSGLAAQTTPEDQVRRAALDYLEGFYEGDEAKIRRGVHPEVVKVGYSIPRGASEYASQTMTFDQMLAFVRRVRERGNVAPETAPKEVELLDVLDQTAAVKVTAWWGTDYLHLARFEDGWKVMHVLWQTSPR